MNGKSKHFTIKVFDYFYLTETNINKLKQYFMAKWCYILLVFKYESY